MKTLINNGMTGWLFGLPLLLAATVGVSMSAYAGTGNGTPDKQGMKVVKNLTNIILDEPQPTGQNKRPTFYANGVELEPFTVHLCGTSRTDPNDPTKSIYTNVDPKEVYKLEFSADSNILLDPEINPSNVIPLIHNPTSSAGTEKAANLPDTGEPDITVKAAETRPIMLIYDETSNYFNLYSQLEGFHIGGVAAPSNAYRSLMKKPQATGHLHSGMAKPFHVNATFAESNKCYADADPGQGDTAVRLYLLATPALQGSTDLPVYVYGKLDTPGNPVSPAKAVHYDIQESPVYQASNIDVTTIAKSNVHLIRQQVFYSFYSSWLDQDNADNGNRKAREELGSVTCSFQVGARFHGLFRYSDHNKDGGLCKTAPSSGAFDCNEHNCERQVSLTTLESRGIPFHDLFTDFLEMGKTCPHKMGALKGGVVFKPILNSSSESGNGDDESFYNSYTGGVGAPFYVRDKDHHTTAIQSVMAGQPGVFYYFSYVFGIAPSPGKKCQWKTPAVVRGHDIYGNPIYLNVVMANGGQAAKVN